MTHLPDGLSLGWNRPEDTTDAAAFAGRIIGQAPEYISHGEIQTGLSPDGEHWAENLPEIYAEDFADHDDSDLLVARNAEGAVCGLLILAWEASKRRKFAVIEDMVVDPDMRSQGLGAALVAHAEERIRERGIEWVFLESGLRNERAHSFFERHGFELCSKVFAKRL